MDYVVITPYAAGAARPTTQGLVISMEEQYNRQHLIDLLNRLGHAQLAEEASRVLPDVVDADWLEEWLIQRGLTHDDLISQMGGSP
jgi:hypothetical protein